MYGWKARLGFVMPTVVDRFGYEFYRIAPEGVGMLATSLVIKELVPQEIDRVHQILEPQVRELADRGADFIMLCGVPLYTTRGHDFDQQAIERVQKITGVPTSTSPTAAVEAFRTLGVSRLAVVTTYTDFKVEALGTYLEKQSFQVLNIQGIDLKLQRIHELGEGELYRFAKQVVRDAAGAEALYIPCAQIAAADIVDDLEQDLGIPVVSTTPAQIWRSLKGVGVRGPIHGWGRILETL